MKNLLSFIKEIIQKVLTGLGFKDKDNDGKIEAHEFIGQLTVLFLHAGYHLRPITDSDVQTIFKFFKIDNLEALKNINLVEIINGMIEMGFAHKK